VPTETASEFDLGPLSWVQGEIDQALARGLAALATFASDPSAASTLAHARNHVHQAGGAILMVGLDAVAAYTDEIEKQLVLLETMGAAEIPETVASSARARSSALSWTSWSTAYRPFRSSCIPNSNACSRRAASKALRRPICSIPT